LKEENVSRRQKAEIRGQRAEGSRKSSGQKSEVRGQHEIGQEKWIIMRFYKRRRFL
jgi:hypothetical protein